ncbi:MAG: DUF502 domain-containing protein [Planctomycetota bacterium]
MTTGKPDVDVGGGNQHKQDGKLGDDAPPRRTFGSDFQRFFGRGLAILLPSVLTLWLLYQLFLFLMNNVGQPINSVIQLLVVEVTPRVVDVDSPDGDKVPDWFKVTDNEVTRELSRRRDEGLVPEAADAVETNALRRDIRQSLRRDKFRQAWDATPGLNLIGLVVAIVVIYFAGLLLGGYIGRRVYGKFEDWFQRLPLLKQVYPHVKRVTEMVLGDRPIAFNRVVVVQYPRKGVWTVALVTGNSMRSIHRAGGAEMVTIFVPSTPTPFTGFTISVPESEVIDLPVGVEEAIRFFITGGVLVPDAEQPGGSVEFDDAIKAMGGTPLQQGNADGETNNAGDGDDAGDAKSADEGTDEGTGGRRD